MMMKKFNAGSTRRPGGGMADLLQLIVSGATGAIYALAALGFTLLWQAPASSTSRRASS